MTYAGELEAFALSTAAADGLGPSGLEEAGEGGRDVGDEEVITMFFPFFNRVVL